MDAIAKVVQILACQRLVYITHIITHKFNNNVNSLQDLLQWKMLGDVLKCIILCQLEKLQYISKITSCMQLLMNYEQ